jgi:hypothetical protein
VRILARFRIVGLDQAADLVALEQCLGLQSSAEQSSAEKSSAVA